MIKNNKKTILLVEDEALIAIAEAQILKKHGYEVLTVNSGEKAIEAIDTNPRISLVLMDIDLGKGIDGPEAAKRILATQDLPIIFLSSHTEPEVVERTEKITSYGYVVKNSGATVLDASIKMAFRLFDAKNKARRHEEELRKSETIVRKKLKAITEPEVDISTLELADIIDVEELQRIMEDTFKVTKVGGAILDVSGKILVSTTMEDICREFHRVHPDTAKNCLESDLALAGGVPVGTFKSYRCKNNMWDMVTPLEIGGKHLGNIYIGQFFFAEEDVDYEVFRKQARQHGFDETAYIAALDRVPRLKRETVDRAMAFYSRLARMISSLSYTTIKLSRKMVQHEQAENALKASHDLLNTTQRIARIGGWEWDVATDRVTWSEELYNITGLDPNSPPPQFNDGHHKIYTKESWKKLTTVVDHTLKTGEPYEVYAQMVRSDGEIRDVYIYGGSSSNDDGSVSGLFGIVEDITDKNQREKQLKESEENLRITLNSIGDAVISTDIDGNIVRMNPVAESLCGWSLNEAYGKSLKEVFHIVHADTRKAVENPVARVLETGKVIGLANHTMLVSKDGTEYQIADSAAPIRDDNGQTTGVVLVFRNVTEEYRKNRHIKESKELLDAVFMSIQDGISVLDSDLSIKYVNPVMERWYASNLPIIGKKCFSAYHNRTTPCAPCPSLRCLKTGKTEMNVLEVETELDSPVQWLELFSYPLFDSNTGKATGVVEFVRDISERKKAEEEIQRQLAEKETLLQEVHHRIKNNMAQIESLLSIQADSADSAEVKSALKEAMSRVRSTRTLYEKLLIGKGHVEVSMKEYLESLIDSLVEVFNDHPSVTIEKRIVDFPLNAKRAVPVGIILNELLTNVFKYAFTGRDGGYVSIKLDKTKTQISLTVTDDGVGFDKRVEANKSPGFGLPLVNILAKQLEGTFSIESDNGTKSVVVFQSLPLRDSPD